MEDTILTIEEVANYLRVSDRTVYDWAQRGEIPAGKIGTVWRFKKSEVEKWVNDRLSSSDKRMKNDVVQVKNILAPNRVIFISQTSRHDALVELANTLSSAPQVKRSDELVSEILKHGYRTRHCNPARTPFVRHRFGHGGRRVQNARHRFSTHRRYARISFVYDRRSLQPAFVLSADAFVFFGKTQKKGAPRQPFKCRDDRRSI